MPADSYVTQRDLADDLIHLLLEGQVKTQEEICDALEQRGHAVNQSKVSRLLRKVGAVKSKNALGQIVYRLPHEPAPPTPESRLSSLVLAVTANETNIVINTSPGSAQLIARIIDFNKDTLSVLATIAGDDVVLVIPKSVKTIHDSLAAISQLLT
ncbi:MAG: transcriptional regulator ArgR [Gammaproteobacteria bacterium]